MLKEIWNVAWKRLAYRVLSYIDDFCVALSTGRPSTRKKCTGAPRKLDDLLCFYALPRYPSKSVRVACVQVIQHQGIVMDTKGLFFLVPAVKLGKSQSHAKTLLQLSRRN